MTQQAAIDPTAIDQALSAFGQWEDIPPVLYDAALQQLQALLEGHDCFVLIDPYLGEPDAVRGPMEGLTEGADLAAVNAMRTQAWQHDCYSIDPEPLRLQAAQSPYLVHLKAADAQGALQAISLTLDIALQDRWQAILQGEGDQHIGGWITLHGPADGKALAAALGARMQVGRLDVGSTYLRLADARLLELLHFVDAVPLQPTPPAALNWAKQLSGIRHWAYPDFAFGIKAIEGGKGELQAASLALTGPHRRVLDEAQAINRALMQWQQHHAKPTSKPYGQILRALQAAQQAGHTAPSAQAQFAADQLALKQV